MADSPADAILPEDWDGTLDNLPAAKALGFVVDEIQLGPTPAWGKRFTISSFDCIPIVGDTPSICPRADRKPQPEWLPQIERRFRELNLIKEGQTIHWVGSQSKVGNVCDCFHPDRYVMTSGDYKADRTVLGEVGKVLKRRGRKKADYEAIQHEQKIADDWERARDAGAHKGDFASQLNLSIKDLDKLLDRVYRRKRSSE